jgi:hypothetical protein
LWLPGAAIVGGTVATCLGGGLADRLAAQGGRLAGAQARLITLGVALLLAAPLAAGVLLLDPPLAFLALLGFYLLGRSHYRLHVLVNLIFIEPCQHSATTKATLFANTMV